MSKAAWGSTEASRVLAFHRDGLLDIFLGLTLLDAWALLRNPSGRASGDAIIILLPLLLVAKRAITAPRLSPDALAPLRREASSGVPSLAAAGAVVLFALGAGVLLGPPSRGALLPHAWGLVALLGLGLVAAAGVHLRAWRFVVYAAVAALGLTLARQGEGPLAVNPMPAVAGLMVAWGGTLLVRFIAIRSRPA